MGDFTFYGSEFSMYSAKLRAYLNNKGLAFRTGRPSALTYRRFIVPRTGVAYMPVLHTPDDEVLQDTTAIIDRLEQDFPAPPLVPSDPQTRLASLLLELYGDEWLLLPAMRYRWQPEENLPVLRQAFGDLLFPWFPRPVRRWLGTKASARFAGVLGPVGITAIGDSDFDSWYAGLLADIDALLEQQPFLLGATATLADFAFAGPFVGHLLHDPAPARQLREQWPRIVAWMDRVAAPAKPSTGSGVGLWPSLEPLLDRAFSEQLPVLRDVATHLAQWAEARHPGDRVPRSVGRHRATIAGVRTERALMTYPVWMLQRACDAWQALSGDERRAFAGRFEADVAGLLGPLPVRLERVDNRLRLASA
ncbi:MAG: glutathione S-transferase family protein [Pseudomonadota bacterium]